MKFTNGYWLVKKEFRPIYAVEYGYCRKTGRELTIYAPSKHISGRGDTLNIGLLTFRISSPMEDVIHIRVSHFEGERERGPHAEIRDSNPEVRISETDAELTFSSGHTKAVISKKENDWGIRFYDDNRLLTSSGFHTAAHMENTVTGKSYMTEALDLDVGENIYGFGEKFTPFVKNGQVVDCWNEDGGTASQIAYKNIPFYMSNKGYGVLVENEGDVSFEVGSEKVEKVQFSAEGEYLDYYVINGSTPKGVLEKYTDLTGKPALPPAWSFGLWLTTSFTTNYDEKTTSSFIDGMAERKIPLRVFHFDCFWMKGYEWCNFTWDPSTFPDPKSMLSRYHKEKGLKICVWINPYIAQQSPLFAEGMDNGYLLKKTDGSVWQTDMWQGGMGIVDFTNPDAVVWYQSKLKLLLDMGVDCFKTDFGERIPVKNIVWHNGADPLKMHNYYTYLYNRAVFELLEREKGKGEACLFARSAAVGGQKFPVHWGGDSTATYPSMAETLRGGLSLASSGFGFWSHDIGGFEQTASADVYKRWCQFGLLSSHSRLHGSSSYRVPWAFDEEACDVLRKFVNLKMTLMPYLYRMAAIAHEKGIPVLRPMYMEFPEDRNCDTLDRQYMLGDSLLVAPVFRADGEVEYYVPEGKWYHYLDKRQVEGGRWYKETYDYFSLPLLVRENTILPVGANDQVPDYIYTDDLTLKFVNFTEGASSKIEVPDLSGKTVLTVEAVCRNKVITVKTTGKDERIKFEVTGNQTVQHI